VPSARRFDGRLRSPLAASVFAFAFVFVFVGAGAGAAAGAGGGMDQPVSTAESSPGRG
jgi:hypothetical protein